MNIKAGNKVLSVSLEPEVADLVERLALADNRTKKHLISVAVIEYARSHYPKLTQVRKDNDQ